MSTPEKTPLAEQLETLHLNQQILQTSMDMEARTTALAGVLMSYKEIDAILDESSHDEYMQTTLKEINDLPGQDDTDKD